MSHNVMVLLEIQKREYKKARTNRNGISIFETKAITRNLEKVLWYL
ncbi:hypothetical protein BN166_2860004 [Clostridioides difficile E10]|nr:hypothetical protein BN166_2860004 [Clostridioides difficile E10]